MLKIDLPQDLAILLVAIYIKTLYITKYAALLIFEIAYLSINHLIDNENVVHLLNIIQLLKP